MIKNTRAKRVTNTIDKSDNFTFLLYKTTTTTKKKKRKQTGWSSIFSFITVQVKTWHFLQAMKEINNQDRKARKLIETVLMDIGRECFE